jgi:pimeloyl-ACP methyl ester carboxylesterase
MATGNSAALKAETLFVKAGGRKIAYRSFGNGTPIILCNRFRGTLDTWDPLFLNALAANYTVIIFEYTGIGRSSGELPADITEVAKDVNDIAIFLGLEKTIVLGWSYGGLVAQAATFLYPELITNAILLGTNPPGKNDIPFEEAFLNAALKPVNDFEDELVLFFEPKAEKSRIAAKSSHERIAQRLDVSFIPATQEIFQRYFAGGDSFRKDAHQFREKFSTTSTPILIISGDHDISFAVENWFPLIHKLSTAQLIILPETGHGPQHQYPEMTAAYIDNFIKHYQVR